MTAFQRISVTINSKIINICKITTAKANRLSNGAIILESHWETLRVKRHPTEWEQMIFARYSLNDQLTSRFNQQLRNLNNNPAKKRATALSGQSQKENTNGQRIYEKMLVALAIREL